MSERTARLDHLLREEISAIIGREISDPRIGFVTVTKVDVTGDLAHATVWVSVIGSPEERRASVRALGRAMPFVRHHLGRLHLKRIPELHAREDDSAERGTRLLHIISGLEEGAEAPVEPDDRLPTPGPARSLPDPDAGAAKPRPSRDGRPVDRRRGGERSRQGATRRDGHPRGR